MSYAKNSPLHPNPPNLELEETVGRIASALESIADSLLKISNPLMVVDASVRNTTPGGATFVKDI